MPQAPVALTMLGTSSGGGPSRMRNCSAYAVTHQGRSLLFDCAEGTYRQLLAFEFKKPSAIDTVLISHIHADHVLGLAPFIGCLLTGVQNTPEKIESLRARGPGYPKPKLQIVGPKGLRQLLRSILTLCGTELGATYVVHELLLPGELPTPSSPEDCHLNEVPGRDVFLDAGGEPFWRDVLNEAGNQNGWVVDAGVIPHRVTSIGYTIRFPSTPNKIPPHYLSTLKAHGFPPSILGRLLKPPYESIVLPAFEGHAESVLEHPGFTEGFKLALLGDTSSGVDISDLCMDADLLVHECTNAFTPTTSRPGDTHESIRAKALQRGHSTPEIAGDFARRVRAKHIVLNHFSTMFIRPAEFESIAEQTRTAWGVAGESEGKVVCADDGMMLILQASKEEVGRVGLTVHPPPAA